MYAYLMDYRGESSSHPTLEQSPLAYASESSKAGGHVGKKAGGSMWAALPFSRVPMERTEDGQATDSDGIPYGFRIHATAHRVSNLAGDHVETKRGQSLASLTPG
jgi:hypothetical protein